MPKLYLLGGENVHKRSARRVNERAFQDAGEPTSVAVFSWARASFDRRYQKRKILTDYFLSIGASIVDFIEYSDSAEMIAQKIHSSNLIYLSGGLVCALLERLKNMQVDAMLRDYSGVIVGRSAGALALCKRCIITRRGNNESRVVQGLGLADLTFKAHYKPKKDKSLLLLSNSEKIYAVPSRSAIIYEDSVCSLIGVIYVFENGKKYRLKSFS